MSIKKQLSAFYVKQGLTGKHLRKAIQHDMGRVRVYAEYRQPWQTLRCSFLWSDTEEGQGYWELRQGAYEPFALGRPQWL